MARYEGMDDILQRVRNRLGPSDVHKVASPAEPSTTVAIPIRERQYLQTVDAARAVLSSAETLRELMPLEYIETLTPQQRQHLETMLEQIVHELRSIERVLGRRASHE